MSIEPHDFTPTEEGAQWIRSWVQMLYLTKLRGYRVLAVHQEPRTTLTGVVRYSRKWLVRPSGGNGRA